MYKIFILFVCFFLSICSAKATWQCGEVIVWEGETYEMLNIPLSSHKSLDSIFHKKYKVTPPSSNNWRGYIGYWSIKDDDLYLDSIHFYDNTYKERLLIPEKDEVFSKYLTDRGIKASWANDTLKIVHGKVLESFHIGFARSYMYEDYVVIKDGVIKSVDKFRLEPFYRNYSIVTDSAGNGGLIDHSGHLKLPCKYKALIYLFSDSKKQFFSLLKEGKYAIMDEDGVFYTDFEFDYVGRHWYKLLSVCKNGKWGFLNQNMQLQIPYMYKYVNRAFYDGIAAVTTEDDKKIIIDQYGNSLKIELPDLPENIINPIKNY